MAKIHARQFRKSHDVPSLTAQLQTEEHLLAAHHETIDKTHFLRTPEHILSHIGTLQVCFHPFRTPSATRSCRDISLQLTGCLTESIGTDKLFRILSWFFLSFSLHCGLAFWLFRTLSLYGAHAPCGQTGYTCNIEKNFSHHIYHLILFI